MNGTQTNLTLKQRRRMQGQAMPEARPQRSAKKELSRTVALLLLLLAFGVGTALGMIYFKPDPRLAELNDMQILMADARDDMPSDVRETLREQFQNLEDQLPRQRRDWGGGGRDMSAFFAMSPADQLAKIRQRAERDKRRDAWMAQREQQAAANPNASQSNDSGKNGNNSNSQGSNNGRRRGGGSDQQRAQGMEQHLANRPPEQRGQSTLMHQMTNAVRQQMSR